MGSYFPMHVSFLIAPDPCLHPHSDPLLCLGHACAVSLSTHGLGEKHTSGKGGVHRIWSRVAMANVDDGFSLDHGFRSVRRNYTQRLLLLSIFKALV